MRPLALLALASAPLLLAAAPAPKAGPPRVLVVAAYKANNWDIYLVQAATGETKNLTEHKAADTEPVWSPDGKQIAFLSDRDGSPDIWVMNADGSEPKQLTRKLGTCSGLKWSPDGSRIAFAHAKAGVDQVYTADATTGKVTQLTDGVAAHRQAAWSPDGTRLSVTSYAGRYATYTMTADGREKTRVNDLNGGVDAHWSPDGARLAFVAITAADNGWRLFTVGADGKGQKQLTRSANTYGNVYPQWSPDGKRISFGELVDGVLQVAVVGADGDEPKVITKGPLHAFTRWAPDGKSLSYNRYDKGKPVALVASAADGEDAKELMTAVGGIAEWKPK